MEWRAIPGWDGKYEVSEHGNVRNVRRSKLIGFTVNRSGYLCVALYGPMRRFRVHQVVAMAFHGVPVGKMDVNTKIVTV